MKKLAAIGAIMFLISYSFAQETGKENFGEDPYEWLHQGKYGLFVHWGIYSKLGGVYNGEKLHCEWIMRSGRIPKKEYLEIASDFNPSGFDADEWVRMIKDAGMSFIMITSKHHDGFAMYDSEVSDFNIMKATPFNRDPIKELQQACEKHGVKLCLYYSSGVDWEDPHYDYQLANDWDYTGSQRDMDKYVYDKCLPQIRELLANYGSIGAFFFDYGGVLGKHNYEIKELMKTVNPEPLTSRLGKYEGHLFDNLESQGDAEIPRVRLDKDWLSPVMMNNNWGFDKYDNNWKSSATIIHMLAQIVSKGGNMAMNVGPTGMGTIQTEAQVRLREAGAWLKQNGEAIYGAEASPFLYGNERFAITKKANKLYIITYDWPREEFHLYGIKSKVKKASLLSEDKTMPISQWFDNAAKTDILKIETPKVIRGWEYTPSPFASVMILEFEDENIEVDVEKMQEPDGTIHVYPEAGEADRTGNEEIRVDGRGTKNWYNPEASFRWKVKVIEPAKFKVILCTQQERQHPWEGNHDVSIYINGQELRKHPLIMDRIECLPENYRKRVVETQMGEIEVTEPGMMDIRIKANKIDGELNFWKIKLVPAGSGYPHI